MSKMKLSVKGFSLIETMLIIVVVAAIGFGGWYIWHTKTTSNNTSAQTKISTANTNKSTDKTIPTDPYAGWNTSCDIYHYCFKYPKDWTQSTVVTAKQPCDAGGIGLTSPDGKVSLSYLNDNNKDSGGLVGSYTITNTYVLNIKGQSLTIVGGYATSDGNQYPSYNLIDTPSSANPLVVGRTADLAATITDQGTGSFKCIGSLNVAPTTPLNASDAKNWFTTTNAQTSLKILKSFYYE